MLEAGLPWYVPTGEEVHATLYGLFHTFTRKTLVPWADIAKECISPENIKEIQSKYHYYAAGFYIPRVVLISIVVVRLVVFTDVFDSKDAVVALIHTLIGV